jgi:hypothetical protein
LVRGPLPEIAVAMSKVLLFVSIEAAPPRVIVCDVRELTPLAFRVVPPFSVKALVPLPRFASFVMDKVPAFTVVAPE